MRLFNVLIFAIISTIGICQKPLMQIDQPFPAFELGQKYFKDLPTQPYKRLYIITDSLKAQNIVKNKAFAVLPKLEKESFSVRMDGQELYLFAKENTGVLYGMIHLAECLRNAELTASDHHAYIKNRGLKFNLPLDLRTPTYSDASDANQQNIKDMWDLDFWERFLDKMAYDRYNTLTWWSLQPFPSMVKVPEFPNISLADVWQSKVKYADNHSTRGDDLDKPYLFKEVEIIKKMSIDEKIAHWQKVMQMAHDRGISIYLFTWNLFTYGTQGQYGITQQQDNPQTIKWLRASVREMLKTYPLLRGIGVTAGEAMNGSLKGAYSNENFLYKTYGEGINDALELEPSREFTFIHRFHWAALDEIEEAFKGLKCKLELSLKYVVAHMYAIPDPKLINEALPLLSEQRKSWLTIRNDDVYSFRWSNTDFARSFIKNLPDQNKIAGIYMGPDGYCWGRDYLSKIDTSHALLLEKQWLSFLQWGRLAYDPETHESYFRGQVQQRLGEEDIFDLWQQSSMVFPLITRLVWGDFDFRWFPEANWSLPSFKGFYTVKDYIERVPIAGSGLKSILEWSYAQADSTAFAEVSPLEIATKLEQIYLNSLSLGTVNHSAADELSQTKSDIIAMGLLAAYYAEKIKAAADLALYDATSQMNHKTKALAAIQSAARYWEVYADIYHTKNKVALYNRVGIVDLHDFKKYVREDIEIVEKWVPGEVKFKLQGSTETPFRKTYDGIKRDGH